MCFAPLLFFSSRLPCLLTPPYFPPPFANSPPPFPSSPPLVPVRLFFRSPFDRLLGLLGPLFHLLLIWFHFGTLPTVQCPPLFLPLVGSPLSPPYTMPRLHTVLSPFASFVFFFLRVFSIAPRNHVLFDSSPDINTVCFLSRKTDF